MTSPTTPTPILDRARELLTRYELLVADIWGVMHDGRQAYASTGNAFARFRAQGGTVVLLSNAPMPSAWVALVLDEKGVRRDAWDAIVSSGDIALAHISAQRYDRVHHVGPDRDLPLLDAMASRRVTLEEAQALVCTGLVDDRNETAETYRPLLTRALEFRLPLVCANPDLIVDVGGDLLACAGVLGALYEEMGGAVYWAGKPHLPAYIRTAETAARLRGVEVARSAMLAIGDAVRTDVAGAGNFGIDSLFIAQGIHRDEVVVAGAIEPRALAVLLSGQARSPVAAMIGVEW